MGAHERNIDPTRYLSLSLSMQDKTVPKRAAPEVGGLGGGED